MKNTMLQMPDALYRYYIAGEDPFLSLNDLPLEQANRVKMAFDEKYHWGGFFAQDDYLVHRREIEVWIRARMTEKGARPVDDVPIYASLGESPEFDSEHGADGAVLRIPLCALDLSAVSFTYPDSMYEFAVDENGEYTGNGQRTNRPKVYLYHELEALMPLCALINSRAGIQHYIEAQIWDRAMLRGCLQSRE